MDQIEQVRQKTDIVELISSYLPLKKAGRNFKALCPFHSEKTPSFIVSPERQIFKCFGCGIGGNAFNFLMAYEKMDFAEALRFLADKAGIKLVSFRPDKKYQEKEKLLAINHLAAEFYHYLLTNHQLGKKGYNYLLQRGISPASIKTFKLGYAPNGWDNLQNFLVKRKGYSFADLEKAGLIIKSTSYSKISYYDRFRKRIIFPLTDHRSNILGFSARIFNEEEDELKKAKYINTPETILYHKRDLFYGLDKALKAIKKDDFVIITEGEFDVISSYQAGVKNIVAIKGSALTENQLDLIKRFTNNIYLALDRDFAGDAASRRGIELADEKGLNIKVIELVKGKDVDECVRQGFSFWRQSIKKALPIYSFYLKSSLKRYGSKTAEAKKKISEELIPIWLKISNEVVKAHYVKKLAHSLEVDEEVILKEMERWQKKEALDIVNKPLLKVRVEEEIKSRREKIEALLLTMLLQLKENINYYLKQIDLQNIKTFLYKRIYLKLKEYLEKNKDKEEFSITLFAKKLEAELLPALDELFLTELPISWEKDRKLWEKEFKQGIKELAKIDLKEKLSNLGKKIQQAERRKNRKLLEKLKNDFQKTLLKFKELN